MVYKTEPLVRGETEYFCSVKNTATGFSFKGLGQGRLEAEYNALASCHEKGYIMNCTADLSCSDGRMTSPKMLVGCMYKNSATGKTFFAKSNSEIQSKFLANQVCQTAGYVQNCGLVRCETGEESWNNFICTISNSATNKTFRGDAKFKLEAEALARQSCESAGYINNCTKDLRCSN